MGVKRDGLMLTFCSDALPEFGGEFGLFFVFLDLT